MVANLAVDLEVAAKELACYRSGSPRQANPIKMQVCLTGETILEMH
jgi:hypothetical protein